jgi:8-oxo-dGTP diphosphatase
MIEATLAFIFDHTGQNVLLIEKEKPAAHKGMLNGLGGKLEAGETHRECVVREIEEEAEIQTDPATWLEVGEITWENWHVTIWTYQLQENTPPTFTDPAVAWYSVNELPSNAITNLTWLIPLCADCLKLLGLSLPIPRGKFQYSVE